MRIRGKRMLFILALIVVMIIPQKVQAAGMQADTLYAYYFTTGSSDCILVELNGKFMLIDTSLRPATGDKTEPVIMATNFMKRKGVKELEYLVITHYDGDHIGGLSYITDNFKVKKFISRKYAKSTLGRMRSHTEHIYPYQNYIKMVNNIAKNAGSNTRISNSVNEEQLSQEIQKVKTELDSQGKWNWIFPKQNEKLKFDDATMTFLYKDTTYITSTSAFEDYDGHVNNDSIVFGLEYKGRSFLFTGDLAPTARRKLISDYGNKLKFDVIKSPHHGYKGSNPWSEYSKLAKPGAITVVTTGKRPEIDSTTAGKPYWGTPLYSTCYLNSYVSAADQGKHNYMAFRVSTTGKSIIKKAAYQDWQTSGVSSTLGTVSVVK